jgi:hypothetical protein
LGEERELNGYLPIWTGVEEFFKAGRFKPTPAAFRLGQPVTDNE